MELKPHAVRLMFTYLAQAHTLMDIIGDTVLDREDSSLATEALIAMQQAKDTYQDLQREGVDLNVAVWQEICELEDRVRSASK